MHKGCAVGATDEGGLEGSEGGDRREDSSGTDGELVFGTEKELDKLGFVMTGSTGLESMGLVVMGSMGLESTGLMMRLRMTGWMAGLKMTGLMGLEASPSESNDQSQDKHCGGDWTDDLAHKWFIQSQDAWDHLHQRSIENMK